MFEFYLNFCLLQILTVIHKKKSLTKAYFTVGIKSNQIQFFDTSKEQPYNRILLSQSLLLFELYYISINEDIVNLIQSLLIVKHF